MENRFGVKDFFLFLVLSVLIVLVILAIWQYDRQWDEIQKIKEQNTSLAGDVGRIKRQLSDGLTLAPGTGPASPEGELITGTGRDGTSNPFYLLEEAQEQPEFTRGDWFVDNFGAKVGKLTPLVSTDVYQSWTEALVSDALVYRDPFTLEFIPMLSRGWTESDDGLRYTFKLRDGITFSNGEPFTADDVVFTFDWIRNPDVDAPRTRAYLDKLESVEAVDSTTVEFTFSEPYFLNFETVALMPVMSEAFYSQYTPAQFNDSVGLLIGTGPYMLESPTNWTPGSGVTLVRNPRYWGEPPAPDRIIFREIEEESVTNVLFGNQELDNLRTTPEQFDRLVADQRIMSLGRPFNYTSPYSGYRYIGWNQVRRSGGQERPTKFANPKVRRALTMLINREQMAEELFRGYATVASGPFAPSGPQSNPDIEPWPYDPDQARELLAEAGWRDRNNDGTLEDERGEPFRFTLTYPSGSEAYEKMILFFRDNFARGGVIMDAEPLQWSVLVEKLNQSDFDAIILGWSGSIESDPYQIFHSDQIKDGGDNRTAYSNSELDELIEQARTTMDPDERMKLWHQVHQILHEDQPYTFLHNQQALRIISNRVQNVEESEVGLNYENLNGGVLPWYIPQDQQKYSQ